MKFLVVFACALAAASAGFVAPVAYASQHLPVIGANGVPVDTPAVQQATAAHLAHTVEAHARNGDYAYAAPAAAAYAPIAPGGAAFPAPQAYPTTVGEPAVTGDGVPLETPEVAAAKSAHFAAHGEALARTGHAFDHAYTGHYVAKRGVYAAAPFAYVAPAYAYGTYGHHYVAKRGIYAAPVAYTAGYTHGAYPYAYHY